jgi:hypothetical protein
MFYGPRGLFTNPGRIIDSEAGCFRFGHQKFQCDFFLLGKAVFWVKDIIQGKKKCNIEEDDGADGDNGVGPRATLVGVTAKKLEKMATMVGLKMKKVEMMVKMVGEIATMAELTTIEVKFN